MHTMRTVLPGSLLLFAVLGCSDGTGPDGSSAAGTYVLESVDGCAPGPAAAQCEPRPSWVLGGEMILEDDGDVTRTMRYDLPALPPGTFTASGTYSRHAGLIRFALVEDGGPPGHVWRPRAFFSDGRLTLRYPHPADGEIVEVFARQ